MNKLFIALLLYAMVGCHSKYISNKDIDDLESSAKENGRLLMVHNTLVSLKNRFDYHSSRLNSCMNDGYRAIAVHNLQYADQMKDSMTYYQAAEAEDLMLMKIIQQ